MPDPTVPKPSPSGSMLATPTITPGHDAEAVAAKDLPLSAGGTLAPGDPVTVSSRLEEVPGWSAVHSGLQGETRYKKTDGCLAAFRVSVNQGPLVVPGDDAASTKELFKYLDATIPLGNLLPTKLRWGQDSEESVHSVEFLTLRSTASGGHGRSAEMMARVFSSPASSVFVSVACPNEETLGAARAEVHARLVVVPPA
ncbi:hypothetical protein AB0N65_04265 [Paenarthrobacter sp. NPDC089322]|uniref:hypothetical protein n=1 Tax=Paenarthrobacter sp. NPDC089322 TaxID=3155065 RepID=UPI003413FC55